MSVTSGAATSNSASSSTFRRTIRASTTSLRVTVAKYSCKTCSDTTPVPARRCSATNSRARCCLAGPLYRPACINTLVSKKLRALMNLVSIETPAMGGCSFHHRNRRPLRADSRNIRSVTSGGHPSGFCRPGRYRLISDERQATRGQNCARDSVHCFSRHTSERGSW